MIRKINIGGRLHRGFTIIEVVVSLTIIGVAAGAIVGVLAAINEYRNDKFNQAQVSYLIDDLSSKIDSGNIDDAFETYFGFDEKGQTGTIDRDGYASLDSALTYIEGSDAESYEEGLYRIEYSYTRTPLSYSDSDYYYRVLTLDRMYLVSDGTNLLTDAVFSSLRPE